jgi:hypothetical protein
VEQGKTVGIALAVLVLLLGLLFYARTKAAPPPSAGLGWPPYQRVSALNGEVVFAAFHGRLDVGLDCLLAPGAQAELLRPVSIEATGPFLCGLGTLYAEALPRRLADGKRVFIQVVHGASGAAKARLKMDESMLLLAVHPNPKLRELLDPPASTDGPGLIPGTPPSPHHHRDLDQGAARRRYIAGK